MQFGVRKHFCPAVHFETFRICGGNALAYPKKYYSVPQLFVHLCLPLELLPRYLAKGKHSKPRRDTDSKSRGVFQKQFSIA